MMKNAVHTQSDVRPASAGGYDWNFERLWKEGKTYVDLPPDQNNLVDATRRTIAGAIHFATGIFESITGDLIRLIQGRENRVDLAPYLGDMPRSKLDISEALQSIGKTFRGKLTAILTLPLIAFKALGDVGADVADQLGGVHRPRLSGIDAALKTEGPSASVDAPMPPKIEKKLKKELEREFEDSYNLKA